MKSKISDIVEIYQYYIMHAFIYLLIYGVFLFLIQYGITGSLHYLGLLWNLFLALVPYFFAWVFRQQKGWIQWLGFIWWLGFFPNSLYLLTDYVHLGEVKEHFFLNLLLITDFFLAWLVIGYASLELVHKEWNKLFGHISGWVMVWTSMFLAVLWVYIGRFLRFNSWDILSHPGQLFHEIHILTLSNGSSWDISDAARQQVSKLYESGAMPLIEFTILYSIFFLILYIFIYEARKVH